VTNSQLNFNALNQLMISVSLNTNLNPFSKSQTMKMLLRSVPNRNRNKYLDQISLHLFA